MKNEKYESRKEGCTLPRYIYLVTHGPKGDGPNPGLTPLGELKTKRLSDYLPRQLKSVVCGTGRRHLDTARALSLEPTRYSIVVGVPESKVQDQDIVLLADGTKLEYRLYTSVADRAEAFRALVNDLAHKSVVITSRSMIMQLNDVVVAKAAAIYRYNPTTKELTELFAATDDTGDGAEEV